MTLCNTITIALTLSSGILFLVEKDIVVLEEMNLPVSSSFGVSDIRVLLGTRCSLVSHILVAAVAVRRLVRIGVELHSHAMGVLEVLFDGAVAVQATVAVQAVGGQMGCRRHGGKRV